MRPIRPLDFHVHEVEIGQIHPFSFTPSYTMILMLLLYQYIYNNNKTSGKILKYYTLSSSGMTKIYDQSLSKQKYIFTFFVPPIYKLFFSIYHWHVIFPFLSYQANTFFHTSTSPSNEICLFLIFFFFMLTHHYCQSSRNQFSVQLIEHVKIYEDTIILNKKESMKEKKYMFCL